MIKRDQPQAPSAESGDEDDPRIRLRRVMREHGFSRANVCRYIGKHENALQRLDDPTWFPRLDTLQGIERFLRKRDRIATFRLDGNGWRIDYDSDSLKWGIALRSQPQSPLGPFDDPDTAVAAGEAWEKAQETHIVENNKADDRSK